MVNQPPTTRKDDMDLSNVKQAASLIREAQDLLGRGPLDYYLTELIGAHEYMLKRFAPFTVGDRVVLVKTPDFQNSPGWRGREHFMVPGALCIVRKVECAATGFNIFVEFEDEAWIDNIGMEGRGPGTRVPTPPEKRHQFILSEDYLHKLVTSVTL